MKLLFPHILLLVMTVAQKTEARDSLQWNHVFQELTQDIDEEKASFYQVKNILKWYKKQLRLKIVHSCENSGGVDKNLNHYFRLEENMSRAQMEHRTNLRKIRYQKGIEMMKMLYEKILSLDHHFSSLQTHQNVQMLTNPNEYPAFREASESLFEETKAKGFELPSFFQSNPYVSVAAYLVNALKFNPRSKHKADVKSDQVSCIMDFTLEMQQDLKTIYYDTEFLKTGLFTLKTECEKLFGEYTSVVGYSTILESCREIDDWENLNALTEEYVAGMSDLLTSNSRESVGELYKKQSDLDFAIDRLLGFILEYNHFISQGEKYYAKFQTIVNNYRNSENCLQYIPKSFDALKLDIQTSMEKFESAYNIAELKGSRLKEVMYGKLD